jgi:hypothetical protein
VGLFGGFSDLDTSGETSPAYKHLGLEDDRKPEPGGYLPCFLRRPSHPTSGKRDARRLEDIGRLIFMKSHSST